MRGHTLVLGGAGFVGSVLVPLLLDRGHRVRVVDANMFGIDHVDHRAELIEGDVLNFERSWLDGVRAVIHLAGLSNDPMAAFSPELNYQLNASATAISAHYAKEAGISKFIFASTCSVYGMDDAALVTEESAARPGFPYAISKLMAETALEALSDDSFRPIILRKGTVVGWSPRMRFDLVVNTMIKFALSENQIVVHDPTIWRPILDVRDAAAAYISALDADRSIGGTFNIATKNYTIGALADDVAGTLAEFGKNPEIAITNQAEKRSYRVSTEKAAAELNFQPRFSAAESVNEIMHHMESNPIDVTDPQYNNVAVMKAARDSGGWRLLAGKPGLTGSGGE